MRIEVYTDGSSINKKGSGGPGGFGIVMTTQFKGEEYTKHFSSGKYVNTTNNRMELKAIIRSLELIKGKGVEIEIFSDSQYCIRSINEWLMGWIKKGKLEEKQNADLWIRFLAVRENHLSRHNVMRFTWVRGHDGNELNEIADRLANQWRHCEDFEICEQYN